MAINKVIYGGNVLIDLTADSITPAKLQTGVTAHDRTGAVIEGECTYDADTQDATATVDEVLSGETFYGQGAKKTGTMPNRGGVTGTISTANGQYTIQQGYHDGSGKVSIDATEKAKLLDPTNIKAGIVLMGTTGTYAGDPVTAETKTVTPTTSQQTVLPTGADYLSEVVIRAIPYVESANTYGTTVTIG